MYYAMMAGSAMLYAIDFALSKTYQKTLGAAPKASFFFNSLLGLLTAVIYFAINRFQFHFSVYSCILAGLMSLVGMSYSLIAFQLLKTGTVSMYTLFLMSGGMTLPYLWGVLFLNEQINALRIVGFLVILAGVILPNFSKEHADVKRIIMYLAVFVLNGCGGIISKIHQSQTDIYTVNTAEYVIISGLFKFVFAGILFLIFRRYDQTKWDGGALKKAVMIIPASALIGGGAWMLQLLSTDHLPATVLYPMITGGTIACSMILGRLVFRERLTRRQSASILLCIAGTLMFL